MAFGITEQETHIPRKFFKNGFLDFAHRHPVIGFFAIPIAIDLLAKVFQGGYRTARHGDYTLGAVAVMDKEDEDILMNQGHGVGNYDLFGTLTANKRTIGVTDPNSGILKGEFYRDTSHLQGETAPGPDGDPHASLYRDTRHLSRPNYEPYSPMGQETGFLDNSSVQYGKTNEGAMGSNTPDQRLLEQVGSGLFMGLHGVR